jgi:hypothetical protein
MKLAISILIACVLFPIAAFADEAADHFSKGTRYYNVQDWPNALKEYKESYTLDPKPETLWAVAQTQRLSGDCRGAILTYKAFMRTASTAGANAASEWIKTCEADLEAQRRAIEATNTPPVEPVKPVPVKPEPTPLVPVKLEPPPPPAPSHATSRSWALDPLGDVLFVVGIGGLAGGGAYFAIGASDASSAPNKATVGDWHRADSTARTDQTIGIIAGSAGIVCVGLAIWRFTSTAHHIDREHAAKFDVVPTPNGGALASFRGSF